MRQKSRRSWRLEQARLAKVAFMSYRNTLQANALKLVGKKLQRSLAVNGELQGTDWRHTATTESTLELRRPARSLAERRTRRRQMRRRPRVAGDAVLLRGVHRRRAVEAAGGRCFDGLFERALSLEWERELELIGTGR